MSRWLNSVNNLLEKLDDQVENVRDVLAEGREDDDDYYTTESDGEDEDDDDDDDEEEEEEDEEEEIDLMENQLEAKEALFPANPTKQEVVAPPTKATQGTKEGMADATPHGQVNAKAEPSSNSTAATPSQSSTLAAKAPPTKETTAISGSESKKQQQAPSSSSAPAKKDPPPPPQKPNTTAVAPKQAAPKAPPGKPAAPTASSSSAAPPKQAAKATPPTKAQAPPPPPPKQQQRPQPQQQPQQKAPLSKGARPPNSAGSGLNTNNKQQVLAEMRQLKKQVYTLQQDLNAANKEIKAQQKELNSAATIVERERQELKEEKEDMKEDHEEELEHLKAEHAETIANLKAKHKQQMLDLKQQLSQEKAERQQEGGDLSEDLQDALRREREALTQMAQLKTEQSSLLGKVEKLVMQQESLQEKLDTALHAQNTAEERQQHAENALDDALEQHKRQLKQRQVREAELERTISEMGTALTTQATTMNNHSNSNSNGTTAGATNSSAENDAKMTIHYKEQWEVAAEEVETLKGQLRLESQRCDALRNELDEINQERTQEAAVAQETQRDYDQKLSEQALSISRLEATVRDLQPDHVEGDHSNGLQSPGGGDQDTPSSSGTVHRLQKQLDDSKAHIKRLSEQLLRQQGMADVHKSEIMALKGRLQAANARAEEAEKTTFQTPPPTPDRLYESEGGSVGYSGYKSRRRVKGRGGAGAIGGRSVTIRSIRAALNMGPGSQMEDVGKTVDALDSWMIDTGAILRHEPLARLAFFLYFVILHLWCFCLVAFHVTEPSSFGAAARAGNGGISSLRGAK